MTVVVAAVLRRDVAYRSAPKTAQGSHALSGGHIDWPAPQRAATENPGRATSGGLPPITHSSAAPP